LRYAVVIVSPPGYPHAEAFREVAESVVAALRDLGHDAVPARDFAAIDRRAIVFGANLLERAGLEPPADAILYNLEQVTPDSPWFPAAMLERLRRHAVWDYSAANVARLAALGIAATLVPIGYHPVLARIERAAEDIDVLFYGSLNPRREAVLDALEARGLQVASVFGVYGAERDALIARAKLVLNVHYYEARVFEIVRVSYLLANRRCVVSETGAEPAEEAAWSDGIAFAPYEGLVDTCVALAASRSERRRLAEAGHARFAARPLAPILQALLGQG
jgi:hypothetical protein